MSRAQVQKALDTKPYVIVGPIFSGSVKVNMMLAQQAEVPQFTGAEATDITQAGNPYIFRTSLSQAASMPKLAAYMKDELKATSGIEVAADISTESGQADFAADVVKVKRANPDAVFVYTNEEESARFLREARKQGLTIPLIGETTLLNQKVIDLAGEAANGVRGHVGLSADAPIDGIRTFRAAFERRFNYTPDHNAIKAYHAVYVVKHVTEKMGKFDSKELAKRLKGMTIKPSDEPGVLMETTWDDKGDVDRESFLAEVVSGKQQIVRTLPRVNK